MNGIHPLYEGSFTTPTYISFMGPNEQLQQKQDVDKKCPSVSNHPVKIFIRAFKLHDTAEIFSLYCSCQPLLI